MLPTSSFINLVFSIFADVEGMSGYAMKPEPTPLQMFDSACISGDLEGVRASWRPEMLDAIRRMGRDEIGQPLLSATHHLRVEVVEFLLKQGLSPRQRGSVHPYTGDQLTVAETQGM